MKMLRRLLPLLALLAVLPAAHADAVVNRCAADDQTGAGTNLQGALAIGGRITFACGAVATIQLNCHAQITAPTTIDGGGTVTLRVDPGSPGCSSPSGSVHYAVFHNVSATPLAFKLVGLKLVGVKPPPSAVTHSLPGQLAYGSFDLALDSSQVSGWMSPIGLTKGSVVASRSTFSDNDGFVVSAPTIDVGVGTVFSNNGGMPLQSTGGAVTVADSQFSGNRTGSRFVSCTKAEIVNTRFASNSSPDAGGALTVNCPTRIAHSTFVGNKARSGGALYIGDAATTSELIDVTFDSNVASADGGAISIRYETYAPIPPPQVLELHGVVFKANQAQIGGALIFARGALPGLVLNPRVLRAAGTQFIDNEAATSGGAMMLTRAEATLSRVLMSGNKAGQSGGAVAALQPRDETLVLVNSVLTANVAPFGAALAGQGTAIVNSTLVDNAGPAVSAAGSLPSVPLLDGPSGPKPIRLLNSIVAGGASAPCGPPDAAAPYIDQGHNLQSGGNGCGATILIGIPQLGPSFIPLPTSPAAHGGDDGACASTPVSARDMWDSVRPYSGHCSIGAAEPNLQNIIDKTTGPVIGWIGQLMRCACWPLRP
jgi:hypothetical protein